MDLTSLLTIVACMFTILGVMIGLFLYLANKIDSFKTEMSQEMRDFHGRLCAIEEKNRK
jgi:hypothetical protein